MIKPRSELFASVSNATTGHVVKLSLGKYFKKCLKITDSQIVLHWISNRKLIEIVIESNETVGKDSWRYVKCKGFIADLGTRKGARIEGLSEDSPWINGYPWMRLDEKDFPSKTVVDTKLQKS